MSTQSISVVFDINPTTSEASLSNGILSNTKFQFTTTANLIGFGNTKQFDAKSSYSNERIFEIAISDIYLEPQEDGGFVAFSREYSGAIGQGETEEEATKDLEEAIQLLKEVIDEDRKKQTPASRK